MAIQIPLSKLGKHAGKYIAVVDDKYGWLAGFNWSAIITKSSAYARNMALGLSLHRAVMEDVLGRPLRKEEFVDHIDGDTLNNQVSNLRIANRSQNGANAKIRKNNLSGFKGVVWDKKKKKWRAQITFNKKTYKLGYFSDPEIAHEVYCKKAQELHKGFWNAG